LRQALLTTRPDDGDLAAELTALLNEGGFARGDVVILEREPNVYSSSYPNDIVRCRLPQGDELELLCKYGSESTLASGHSAHGSRGGVGYEAAVYQYILTPSTLPALTFYGSRSRPERGEVWLVVEFAGRDPRISQYPEAMPAAARWLGTFHRVHAGRTADFAFLKEWDRDYYRGFVERTVAFVGRDERERRWLAELENRFDEWAAPLLREGTIVHGEYYPDNVLFKNGTIYPIDWESAAIGAGDVDLAALTEGWEPEVVHECEEAYCKARWPEDVPADFHQCLTAARLFVACRWLGDPAGSAERFRRVPELRRLAAELGLGE
jgi:hypothetical protein